jgi:transposase
MIIDTTRGIPVMYDLYPDCTADASNFGKTLHRLQAGGVDDCTLVLDQGFFSVSNIVELNSAGRNFIIPASRGLKSVRELLSSVRREIDRPEYLQQYGKCRLFVKPVTLPVGDREIKGYCYYDPGRERTEQRNFYVGLNDTLEKLRKTKIPEWRDAEDVFKEKTGRMHNFFYLEKGGDGFEVQVRRNAVSQYVNRLGMFILLYEGEADWQECLSAYVDKDIVEQALRLLRCDAETSPLNMEKVETVRGLLLVGFLGLILRTRLSKRMKESGLWKRYTVDSLLLELEGIKKIKLEDGSFITTQLTRGQKEIVSRLRLSVGNPGDMP